MTAQPLTIFDLVHDAYGFVSGHLTELFDLGKGPAVVAVALGLLFDLSTVFQATPVYTFATMIAFSWFSFYIFRLILLGPGKARPPAPPTSSGEAPARQRPLLANFMGRALTLGIAALGVFFLITIIIVFPLAMAQSLVESPEARLVEAGFEAVDTLILTFALFGLPVAIPLARYAAVLPPTAIGRDTALGAAWRLSRGYGLKLACAWMVIAAPYVLSYAILNAALTQLSRTMGGDGAGIIVNLIALILVTAMGLTITALATHATARTWSAMTAIPTPGDRPQGPRETMGVTWD
ncbi:MAG: hypothetical protein CMM46_09715 [Rhodospirillaceae bacterium]|nr:hypothetical protein [Rhodospirillaceae bacterium]|tara:strand:+ start:7501 stop:8382 length:882 start_codon:yes stop_codon:yes gene_type:complete